MKKSLALFFLVCFFLGTGIIYRPDLSAASVGSSPGNQKIKHQTNKIQLPFIANVGQIDNKVKYYARTFNGSCFVTQDGELVYSFAKPHMTDTQKTGSDYSVMKERFTGNIKAPAFKGEGEGTKISIYKGKDPAKWKKNIPSYQQISMGDIYQGIELKLKAYGDTIEKIFSVKPGADPKAIRARLEGVRNLKVNGKGELEIQTDIGAAVFSKPVAYQVKVQAEKGKEQREYIQVSYLLEGDQYGFRVGDYDKTRELIIDPYVGVKFQGSAEDRAYAVMTFFGESHSIYVAGYSYSYNFPINAQYGNSGTSDSDIFVAKLSEDLSIAEHIVFIAGAGDDFAYSLAIDLGDNVYVAGTTTSSDLPIPGDYTPDDDTYNGGTDVFVAKLSNDLSSLIALTYLGGSSLDAVNADSLAIDGYDLYVTGYTISTDFPAPDLDAYDSVHNGGEDVFIAIFNTGLEGDPSTPGLEELKSTTFIGSTGNERPYGIAIRSGYSEVYVAGYTTSTNYPTTTGAYNEIYNGGAEDAFISRIISLGYSPLENLASSTFLGGSETGTVDEIHGLAISGSPDYSVYVTGNTNSSVFPGTCTQGSCGGMDVFVAQFGTFLINTPAPVFVKLGGTSSDYGKSLILSGGMIFVSGVTYSSDFPTNAFDTSFGGTHGVNSDGFVLRFDSSLVNFDASTYIGGSADDFAPALASDTNGDIYVAGSTNSTDFPTTLTSYGGSSGGFEAYVAKFDDMLVGTSCIYTFNPENTMVSASGGNFSFGITTSTGCAWAASIEESWIRTTSSGNGSGTVNYTVDPNTGRVRQAMMYIEGKLFTVTQNGTNSSLVTDPSTGQQYQRFDELQDRNGAQSVCQGLGGHLVTITSASEQAFVYDNLVAGGTPGLQDCWIGAIQPLCTPEPSCGWEWVTGEQWEYDNFLFPLEPNNAYGLENSIVMLTFDGHWNDFPEAALQSFVCEWDAPSTYSLSVLKAGTGTGSVVSAEIPPQINCGTGCEYGYATYESGTQVTLTATADANSSFVGWSGGVCTGTGNCQVTMDGYKSVYATFTKQTSTVSTQAGQGGSINPTSRTVGYGETAQFTVTADTGYHIGSVSGCGGTPYANIAKKKKKVKLAVTSEMVYTTGQITEACTVTASFAQTLYTVTPSAGAHGSMSPSTPQTVHYPEQVIFEITPDEHYHIASVTGCGVTKYQGELVLNSKAKKKKSRISAVSGELYITGPISGDCTVSAQFGADTYTVTPSAGEHGSMSPADMQEVAYNDTASFEITADGGYHIESVTGCGGTPYTGIAKKKKKRLVMASALSYTTGKITEDCTVTASFAMDQYTVTPSAGEHGSINPSEPQVVNPQEQVLFEITADEHYHIESVSGCGIALTEENGYITEPITEDCTVETEFAADTFITSILQTGGSGTVTGSGLTCDGETCTGSYAYGTKVVLKINPDAGYRIIDVKINGVSLGPINTLSIKQIMDNYSIEIVFGPA